MRFHLFKKLKTLNSQRHFEFLAQRFGIPRYAEHSAQAGKPSVSRSLKSELYELHKVATDWFHQRLLTKTRSQTLFVSIG